MSRYSYRPELKSPPSWGSFDFGAPGMQNALRALQGQLRRSAESFTPPEGVSMERLTIDAADGAKIPCYRFTPESLKWPDVGLLYCHGGGFFLPIQPMMTELAAQYARALGLRVYLPEYRLLPEFRAPVPLSDCRSALETMAADGMTACLLYGESVGGTLAAGLAQLLRDEAPCRGEQTSQKQMPWPGADSAKPAMALLGQCLIYPALDHHCSRYPSVRQYSEGAWPLRNNLTMWQQYLKDGVGAYTVPMLTEDLRCLPPAYIEAQEIDILRDEALAYADRLEQAGVPVGKNLIKGSYHGFDADTQNPFVQSVIRQRIAAMNEMLERNRTYDH